MLEDFGLKTFLKPSTSGISRHIMVRFGDKILNIITDLLRGNAERFAATFLIMPSDLCSYTDYDAEAGHSEWSFADLTSYIEYCIKQDKK